MKRRSLLDDEIPLTHQSSPSRSVTQETRSRFDALLKAAHNQEKSQKKGHQSGKRGTSIELVETNPLHQKKITTKHKETNLEPIASTSRALEILSTSEDDVISTQELEKTSSNRNLLPKLKTRKKSKKKDKSITPTHKKQSNNVTNNTEVANFGSSSEEEVYPVRRLSYVIEKPPKDPPSAKPSPFKEIPPHPASRPVPKPRQRHGLQQQSRRSSLADEEVSSPKAPPLYSKTAASYENLERDGGSLHSLHRRARSGEEIEMAEFNPKLSAPEASYEEISSMQRSRKRDNESEENLKSSPTRSTSTPAADPSLPRYDEVIGVWVHKTDRLKVDPLVCRPLVKVHVIDAATGAYLKKSDTNRSVAYFQENVHVDYVAPLMTHEFNFHARRSIIPTWEELLVFNDDISCILNHDKPVIIFFEVLNSVSFSLASARYKRLGSEGCWLCIAWAFLKPTAANNATNVGPSLRLQLYEPASERKPAAKSCQAYSWWRRGSWKKYPASLHVTVKPIKPPNSLARVLRSQLAMQGELLPSQETLPDNDAPTAPPPSSPPPAAPIPDWNSPWSRMPGQSCKLPNALIARDVVAGTEGCFTLAFSRGGRHLACATCARDANHAIVVIHMPDGGPGPTPAPVRLAGHRALVYDLDWSPDDSRLLSASADRTACVWDVATSALVQLLPHPAFVYCARFSPRETCIVTGCSDNVLRIWGKSAEHDMFLLVEELEEHTGFITSMCFDLGGGLISADSIGRILVWPSLERRKTLTPRELRVRELREVVINSVACHPGGKRLLVHARDSLLRMLDLATGSVIQWFHGALNYRVQTHACMSPCGGLVLAASETGTVCVWDADTGEQTAIYASLGFHRGASGVAFHPRDHVVAFCSGSTPNGVVVAAFEKNADGKQLGLQLLGRRALEESEPQREEDGEPTESTAQDVSTTSNDNFSRKKVHTSSLIELGNGKLNPPKAELSSDGGAGRLKLVDIIERMDKVFLSTTPSRSSGRVSGNSTPRRGEATKGDARSRRRSINNQRSQLEGRN